LDVAAYSILHGCADVKALTHVHHIERNQRQRSYTTALRASTKNKAAGFFVTSRLRDAFQGLIIDESILNQVGPAVNSASSVMLFGFPGNGKATIAERITLLMGDDIFIPYTVYADGTIVKFSRPPDGFVRSGRCAG
jgi:hypothetical protein